MDAATVIEEMYPQIVRSAVLLTGNRAEAEDLAQETFLQVIRSWEQFAGRSSRKTWVYSILTNVHRRRVRSEQRSWNRWLKWFETGSASKSPRPDDSLLEAEWKNSLWAAVKSLPVAQRHVVVLRYFEDMPYDQIAAVVGCPVGTVKSRIHVAIKKLNQEFAEGDSTCQMQTYEELKQN